VRLIKSRRLAWLGHVARMDGNRVTRRVMEWKPMGRRMRGRPRKRWIDDVEEDVRTMGVRGWRRIVKARTEWKKNSSNRLRPTQGYKAIRRRRRRSFAYT
jgi:hypothetical protein